MQRRADTQVSAACPPGGDTSSGINTSDTFLAALLLNFKEAYPLEFSFSRIKF